MLLIHCIVIRQSRSHSSVGHISNLNTILCIGYVVLFRKKEILGTSCTIIIPYS